MNSTQQFPRIPLDYFVSRIICIPKYSYCELFVFLSIPTANYLSYLYFFKVDLICTVCITKYSYVVLFGIRSVLIDNFLVY